MSGVDELREWMRDRGTMAVERADGSRILFEPTDDENVWRSTEQVDGEWVYMRIIEVEGEPFLEVQPLNDQVVMQALNLEVRHG